MRGGSWDSMLNSTTCSGAGSGVRALGGGYEPTHIMEARSPAPANTWLHSGGQVQVKQEPMEHDSSAYGSGSDGFHSSSPAGSDHSRDSNPIPPYSTHINNNIPISQYYSTPITNRLPTSTMSYHHQPLNNGFNPLTPPSFEPISPRNQTAASENFQENHNATLTPCTTPPSEVTPPKSPKNTPMSEADDSENDHLRRLQMAFERNGMLPGSPKGSDNRDSVEEDGKSDYEMDDADEGLRVPRVNSHGKVKTFKCKQCDFVAVTKLDFWEHSRGHIKVDKMLTCPKCPFVTEYKHHLEYHLRNHFGSKPFKCDKCPYTCVNKSMLNSHLKSHSNIYQYRCADCTYATKYCHSLKLHLRKYKHSPAMVLNPDGTPNPLPIIDVYGTRRGPKQKPLKEDSPSIASPPSLPPHSIFPPFMLPTSQPSGMPLPFPYGPLLGAFSNPLLFPQMTQGQISPTHSNDRSTPESLKIEDNPEPNKNEETEEKPVEESSAALDLSKPEITLPITVPEVPVHTPVVPSLNPAKNRRKGRAFKLERISVSKDASSDEDILENKSKTEERPEDVKPDKEDAKVNDNKKTDIFNCQYCDIAFRDVVMYTMHMGYHGYKDPFTCNMCGEQSVDKVSFFLHIARTSHS